MNIRDRLSSSGTVNRNRILLHVLDGYCQRVTMLRKMLGNISADWKVLHELSGWSYDGLDTSGLYHVFQLALPVDFDEDEDNQMYYNLFNIQNFGTQHVVEIPEDSESIHYIFLWSNDETNLKLYIPAEGDDEDKYIYWLPEGFTQTEEDLFFDIHTFNIDYKKLVT